MGFSLKRALAGAVVGGAHVAGEVYDAQLKEAAITRQREAEFERQKELQAHQADILMDRENRRDEIKAARADKDQEKVAKSMSEIRTAVREKGLDPDKIDGLRYAAGLADEKGYTAIADKYRVRLETERSHTANEENKKIRMAELGESHANRKRAEMDAEERKAMGQIESIASQLVVRKYDPDTQKEMKEQADDTGAKAAMSWAYDEIDKNRSYKNVRRELSALVSRDAKAIKLKPELGKLPGYQRFQIVKDFDPNAPVQAEVKSVQGTSADTSTSGSAKKPDSGGGMVGGMKRIAEPSDNSNDYDNPESSLYK